MTAAILAVTAEVLGVLVVPPVAVVVVLRLPAPLDRRCRFHRLQKVSTFVMDRMRGVYGTLPEGGFGFENGFPLANLGQLEGDSASKPDSCGAGKHGTCDGLAKERRAL